MGPLIVFFVHFWDKLSELLAVAFNGVQRSLAFIVALLVAAWALYKKLWLHLADLLRITLEEIDMFIGGAKALESQVGDGSSINTISEVFAVMNTFSPIDEIFSIFVLLSVLWIAANIYRFVKSWIPTVS